MEGCVPRNLPVKPKKTIVGSPCARSASSINEKLVKGGHRRIRLPDIAVVVAPAGNSSPTADDRVFTMRRLPDGVTVLWAEDQSVGQVIRSRMNCDRDWPSLS